MIIHNYISFYYSFEWIACRTQISLLKHETLNESVVRMYVVADSRELKRCC